MLAKVFRVGPAAVFTTWFPLRGGRTTALIQLLTRSAAVLARLLARPEMLLVTTFAALVIIGTLALHLPAAHAREGLRTVDHLFIATSAVCVTGLTSIDTATSYSRFGQVVIMTLIQIGGLGIMTFTAVGVQLFRMRVSFGAAAALHDSFFESQARGVLARDLRWIIGVTLAIEAAGAVLIYVGLRMQDRVAGGWFEAAFLAVSAFCNAGFSQYSDNLMPLRESWLVLGTVMMLIIAGGLGYSVLFELLRRLIGRLRGERLSPAWGLQSRIVLRMTALLLAGGTATLFLAGMTTSDESWVNQLWDALFHSVSARTAGFNTVHIGALPLASLLILIMLMFIGGSPGSCAGGIKTTTFAICSAQFATSLSGHDDVNLFGRRIPPDIVRRAGMLVAVVVFWNAAGVMLLSVSETTPAASLSTILFEQISAFGTVGLSAGLTPELSDTGKLWIIATMFFGRVGPLTATVLVLTSHGRARFEYPRERVMVG